ncbi:MAG TPA: YtxH domain-containing protein [Terriglobales bacterium]|jgi:gas vesicle protein|nr:YtxH domain-containing protein [Terriglobales bacterium]
MQSGKYESSEGGNIGTALTFLLIGLGAGALVGLLYAPKTGRQMRKDLRKKYDGARETLDDWKDQAREAAEDVIDRGAEIADEVRERVTPLTKAVRR